MKLFGSVVGAVIGFFVVLALIMVIGVYGFGWFQKSTANFRGDVAVKEKTRADGDYRISAYDTFFNKCAAVQSLEAKITNLEEDLKKGAADPYYAQGALTAAKNRRAELIAEYNADAAKDYTRGQFRDSDLPYHLDQNTENTTCAL